MNLQGQKRLVLHQESFRWTLREKELFSAGTNSEHTQISAEEAAAIASAADSPSTVLGGGLKLQVQALLYRVSVRGTSQRGVDRTLLFIRQPDTILASLVMHPIQLLWLPLWLRRFKYTLTSSP